jgi:hypothetical protein
MRCPRCHRDLTFPEDFALFIEEPLEPDANQREAPLPTWSLGDLFDAESDECASGEILPGPEGPEIEPIRWTLCRDCCRELLEFMRLVSPVTRIRIIPAGSSS